MEYLINLILLFFAFSLIGWCIEVVLKYRQYHRFINRGFLVGPCLPIYGSGAVLITLSVLGVSQFDDSYGVVFLTSFIVCGLVEYFASFYMEKKFHARWWDYSQKPMNLHGRVWIGNLILFGLGGLIIIVVANPLLLKLFALANIYVRGIVAGILSAVFIADFTLSHFIMKLVKQGIEKSEADNTEEIGREIRLLLSNRSVFHKRFAEAYPDVVYKTDRIAQKMEAIRVETERLRKEAEEKVGSLNQMLDEGKSKLISTLEPTAVVKNSLIQKQEELIGLLYDETTANEEAKILMAEIEEKKKKIQGRSINILQPPNSQKC